MSQRKWDKASKQWLNETVDGNWVSDDDLRAKHVQAAHSQAAAEATNYRQLVLAKRSELEECLRVRPTAWIYDYAYMPVDSSVYRHEIDPSYDRSTLPARGLDLSPALSRGFRGWAIVATIPRTLGEVVAFQPRSNLGLGASTGHTNYTAIGGTVIGVYLVFGREITYDDIEGVWAELEAF